MRATQVENYFTSPRINVSLLKMLSNPFFLKSKLDNPDTEDDDKRYYRIGAALDTLRTEPDSFQDRFAVINADKPFGLMGKFIDALPPDLTEESPIEAFEEAYKESGYRMNINTVVNKL